MHPHQYYPMGRNGLYLNYFQACLSRLQQKNHWTGGLKFLFRRPRKAEAIVRSILIRFCTPYEANLQVFGDVKVASALYEAGSACTRSKAPFPEIAAHVIETKGICAVYLAFYCRGSRHSGQLP